MLLCDGQIWKISGSRKIHLKPTNVKGKVVLKIIVNKDPAQYLQRGRLASRRTSLIRGLGHCLRG